jgi:hypothetical protein
VLHSASESVHIFIKNVQKIKLTDTYDDWSYVNRILL